MSEKNEIQTQVHDTFKAIAPRLMQFMDTATIVKECNFAMQAFNRNSYLDSSTPTSKQQAVLNVAQIGLTLNPVLKYAYLVPRYSNNQVECFLEPSYQGLVKLITDTGSAKSVTAYPVYDGDLFESTLGTKPDIMHKPKFLSKTLTHVYAVANLQDGSQMMEIMHITEVHAIRDKSEGYKSFVAGKAKSCIWVDHEPEMARKTVIKRLCKYLPKTEMWDKLATAIDLDNSDYPASDDQRDYIESLLRYANFDQSYLDRLERELRGAISTARASELIEELQANQVDPIHSGHAYGMKEINNKITNEIDAPKESLDNNEESTN